jgi:hypothetical protein
LGRNVIEKARSIEVREQSVKDLVQSQPQFLRLYDKKEINKLIDINKKILIECDVTGIQNIRKKYLKKSLFMLLRKKIKSLLAG